MSSKKVQISDALKKCIDFHGHLCPGLVMGYKASLAGMEWLKAQHAADEEMVAIVETDACCVDAVQVITGCTFGKGNFIFKDHGKVAFTFFSRNTGNGVRIALKPTVFAPDERHMELMAKMRKGSPTRTERKEFERLHEQKSFEVLAKPFAECFTIREVHPELPQKAVILPSKPCVRCGEPVMASKLDEIDGELVCRSCQRTPKKADR